jgi:glycosyltransferase involved in cell wall biosynthesis
VKILLVTEYFYPQSSGGTELYVYNLAKALQKQNQQAEVLSLFEGEQKQSVYNDLTINYIPFNRDFKTAIINGEEKADNVEIFCAAVQKINPDVIHFHTITTSIGAYHIEAIKRLGFKVVLTSHIAAHTCIRGNLMQLGKFICDGKVEEKKCFNCYLQHKGIAEPLNYLSSFIIRKTGFPKNTAKVVEHKKKELQKFQNSLDQLVVVSQWQREVFIKNGFNPHKLNLCRQAVEVCKIPSVIKKTKKLVLGFIGRITSVKGLHVLLSSLKYVAVENLELRIAAIPVETEMQYYNQQKQQAEALLNVVWIENLPNQKVGEFLQELDILCVPSQIPETGPFVVYEALAQGTPVLGSNLGGIQFLIL